jgi:hypothetical protein
VSTAEVYAPGEATPADDGARADDTEKLSVADLVRLFEESEDATWDSRQLSERDRDYVDNIQLTAEEKKVLRKRGQPEVIVNLIQHKVNYLVGLEKQQRVMPKAMPRTPVHEQDADAATQSLRYVAEAEDYSQKRSGVWRNMLVEGSGGIAVAVKPSKYNPQQKPQAPQPTAFGEVIGSFQLPSVMGQPQQYDVELRRIAWDRMFADPHSSELDYSDAGYKGVVLWMDLADALETYKDNPDAKDILEFTLSNAGLSNTYDDKPKFRLWADRKRKRVRIVQIWLKRGDDWHFAEFTKGGILKAGASPYVTDTGESDCELFFQACYKNRENEAYGVVRAMVPLQDEINKRRSKALHLLNTAQVVYEEGAVEDIEKFRREAARADGTMKINPGFSDKVKFNTRNELATGHVQLLQEAKNDLDLMGPNATMLGDKAQGSSAASGKAVIASQQGGMTALADPLDGLRHLDNRVFRAIWCRIRQFWTAEKWIRVTDDERNIKWVGVNTNMEMVQDEQTGQSMPRPRIDPATGQPAKPTMLAELDCDIIIDEAPDTVTPQLEQWQSLVELKKSGANIPEDVLIEAAPNLKNKDKILERMQQQSPMAQMQAQIQQIMAKLQIEGTQAKVAETQARTADIAASADLKRANAMKVMHEAQAPADIGHGAAPVAPQPLAGEQALADLMNTVADTGLKKANTALVESKTHQTAVQTHLAPAEFAARRTDAATRQAQPPRTLQ